jgi:Zn-dependent protease with chaperone function
MRSTLSRRAATFASVLLALVAACQPAASPPAASPPPPAPAPAAYAPYTATLPAPASTQAPMPYPWPAPAPAPVPGPAPPTRPLLGPLLGPPAWQAEVRAVARELVSHLSADYQARVASVPFVFDPNQNDVNAFASCDDHGAPLVTATEGLLDAMDAISETRATDELFGTHTYEAYASTVAPRLVTQGGGSALLPLGIIPPLYLFDARRVSRAHELFDEIAAFTFGHELSHHYLGHTGCAMGQAGAFPQAVAQLGQFLTSGGGGFNQPNEILADNYGCRTTLDTGLARTPAAYRWTEVGALWLLDFFGRLSRASGATPFLSILLSHPDPALRITLVQGAAASWHLQHPG